MKIGIFDSGLGGLCVLHYAQKLLPDAQFVYYADEQHVPYGEKPPKIVQGYVKEIMEFLLTQKVDAIVIACNTATSLVGQEYRQKFPIPIIGMEPALKLAVDKYGFENKRIMVTATPITIGGQKLKDLSEQVDSHHMADFVALPELVRFAESGDFESDEVYNYLRNVFHSDDLSLYGTIVLGCTHFNYFKKTFQKLFSPDIHFADGNEGTIHQVMRLLSYPIPDTIPDTHNSFAYDRVTFYCSGEQATEADTLRIQRCVAQLDSMYEIK